MHRRVSAIDARGDASSRACAQCAIAPVTRCTACLLGALGVAAPGRLPVRPRPRSRSQFPDQNDLELSGPTTPGHPYITHCVHTSMYVYSVVSWQVGSNRVALSSMRCILPLLRFSTPPCLTRQRLRQPFSFNQHTGGTPHRWPLSLRARQLC